MQRLHTFGLALTAILILGALATATASAATTSLPFFNKTGTFTSTSGALVVNTAANLPIKCTKDKGLGVSNGLTSNLGTYDVSIEGCGLLGEECKTAGDAAGVILIVGTNEYHLVRLLGPTLRAGIWFLIKPFTIECKFAGTKMQWAGNVLGSITPENTKTTKYTILVNATTTAQEITDFQNNKLEAVFASLTASINKGKSEALTVNLGEDVITLSAADELLFK